MSRNGSVDTFRAIAIVFVIAIHTTPFENIGSPLGSVLDFATLVNQTARFAVPFFFVISGYFWASKVSDKRALLSSSIEMIRRILIIFSFWSLVYLLPTNIVEAHRLGALGPIKVTYWKISGLLDHPLLALLEGSSPHLWFLISLATSVAISAAFLHFDAPRALVLFAVVLYAVGLAGKAYAGSPIGFSVDFNFRNGPFFSLLLFVTGYLLQQRGPDRSWVVKGAALTILGITAHGAEISYLHHWWGATLAQDYVAGTYFLGVGVAMLAISNPSLTDIPILAPMGPLVLGIYASHYAFVDLLRPLDSVFAGMPIWEVGYVLLVLLLSYLTTVMMARYRLTKSVVA